MLEDTQPRPFTEYFADSIKVVGYPMIGELLDTIYNGYRVIINVSDEMYTPYAAKVMQSGREYYWFPLGECGKDMGLNSLFGALSVMYQSYHRDKKLLLHCHAGANRSPTTYACFHYMMTGTHLVENRNGNGLMSESNMLLFNCRAKHLPDEEWMKIWLMRLKYMFDDYDRYIGGMFDWSVDFSRALKTKR